MHFYVIAAESQTSRRYSEDHEDTREMLRVGLETDFSITVYKDAAELFTALEQEKFSAIVADILLPGLDGFGFIKTIRRDSGLPSSA